MPGRYTQSGLLYSVLLGAVWSQAHAQGVDPGELNAPLDNVTIIGQRLDPADVPGSAHLVKQEDLQLFLQSDVLRMLRTVPGVYLQEEEGFGLRPNIGIRGSGLDRSARIALLEDGVLIAPAPYAAPSAYYFPTQRRMYALEVLKGPAAVAVGPRTTGGAINLISTPVPDQLAGHIDLRLGQNSALDTLINVGNGGQRFSWLLETVQAQNDGFKTIDGPAGADTGPTGYNIQDYMLKLQLDNDPSASVYQSLRLKAGYTDQVSDETYLGLTDADFLEDPYRRYAASAGDQFVSDHRQLQLSYVIEPDAIWRAEITAYRHEFARNWFKLQSVEGAGLGSILNDPLTYASELAYLQGADSPDDAIVKRHNNRSYYSQGLQGTVTFDLAAGDTGIQVTTGGRLHVDEEDRLQKQDGFRMQDMLLQQTSSGSPGSQTNRVSTADAGSVFVDTRITTGAWTFTPGLRFESIELERRDYSTSDPGRLLGPDQVSNSRLSVWIPAVGALYEVNDQWRLLAGVSRGFNPPAPGSTAAEENSTNFEGGVRYHNDMLALEAIYFSNDYNNLVGTVTESTGGGGEIGDQYDGGMATVRGVELSADTGWTKIAGSGLDLPLSVDYTWTAESRFHNAFESDYEPWGDVLPGDQLPYVPEHQLRVTAGLTGDRWAVNLAVNYVGSMRAVAGQGPVPANEAIGSHVVWDILGSLRLTDSFSAYAKVDNLLDETYVAARRPAGLRPGLERTAYVGLTYRL